MTVKVKRKKVQGGKREQRIKWWKLKKEECCVEFREEVRHVLGGRKQVPVGWAATAEVVRETARKVLGLSSGKRKQDKET